MRRKLERCGECTPAARCVNHQACATQRDAALAAEIGAAWAVFVRGQVDVRRPWPPFAGRVAAIARRLVAALAPEPRRSELARICHWRAGLKWEALERPRIRDRPYEVPDGGGVVSQLPGALRIQFRTRRRDRPYEVPDGGGVVSQLPGALRIQFRTRRRASTGSFRAQDAPSSRRRGRGGR